MIDGIKTLVEVGKTEKSRLLAVSCGEDEGGCDGECGFGKRIGMEILLDEERRWPSGMLE